MRKSLPALLMLVAYPTTLLAEWWSFGAATGPFVFGQFAERTTPIATEVGSAVTRSRLSAATRPGAAVDIERDLNERLALGLEGTWTRAPLRIKSGSEGVNIDAGRVNATTFVAPLAFRINARGAFRFHLMAGPAYALYSVHRRAGGGATLPLFEGTRARWGGMAGAGVAWWWSNRFGLEWNASDIITASPFRVDDLAASSKGVHIPQAGERSHHLRNPISFLM
jgi:hypothetical protein